MKNIMIAFAVTLFTSFSTLHADVILNEYNAVSGSNHLDEAAFADSTQADTEFGRIQGNGGNWFELLVIGNANSAVVDMRGWSLGWEEEDEISPGVNAQGTITLSNDSFWSTIERGTLLTFIETSDGGGVAGIDTSTDTSFDGSAGDWHMNFSTLQEQATGTLLTTTTNDGVAGEFSVGNDNWQLTIFDSLGNVVSRQPEKASVIYRVSTAAKLASSRAWLPQMHHSPIGWHLIFPLPPTTTALRVASVQRTYSAVVQHRTFQPCGFKRFLSPAKCWCLESSRFRDCFVAVVENA